jgi:Xaa-Pro aminopeptidase
MVKVGLDALLVYSWKRGQVHYISGYTPNYIANVAIVVLPINEEPSLFIRFPFDLERAKATCWFENVQSLGNPEAMVKGTAAKLQELQLEKGNIGLISGDTVIDEFPYSLYNLLRNELPNATFVDAKWLLIENRLTKSHAEFELIKKSAQVADMAVESAEKALKFGASEFSVVSLIEMTAREAGANDYLVAITSQGKHELIGPPEHKYIDKDAIVILEVAIKMNGYWAQVARTYVVGDCSREQIFIYKAALDAYIAGLNAICPGIKIREVSNTIRASLETTGYLNYLEHDIGHGLGLDLPEPPALGEDRDNSFQEGMVIALHPSIRVPGIGSAFIGGTVLLTKEGPLSIHKIPESLI